MIKGNESDVGNIDFELQAKIGDNCSCFIICFELQRIGHISATRCSIETGFGSKCSILNEQEINDSPFAKLKEYSSHATTMKSIG